MQDARKGHQDTKKEKRRQCESPHRQTSTVPCSRKHRNIWRLRQKQEDHLKLLRWFTMKSAAQVYQLTPWDVSDFFGYTQDRFDCREPITFETWNLILSNCLRKYLAHAELFQDGASQFLSLKENLSGLNLWRSPFWKFERLEERPTIYFEEEKSISWSTFYFSNRARSAGGGHLSWESPARSRTMKAHANVSGTPLTYC